MNFRCGHICCINNKVSEESLKHLFHSRLSAWLAEGEGIRCGMLNSTKNPAKYHVIPAKAEIHYIVI